MFHLKVAQSDFQQWVDIKEASQLEEGSGGKELTCQEGFACCQLEWGKKQVAALQLCVNTKHHSPVVDGDKKRLFSNTKLSNQQNKTL